MKDAFNKEIFLESNVLYSTGGGAGTSYYIGKVVKLYPCSEDLKKSYNPDRVAIQIEKSSDPHWKLPSKNPIVYSSNVILLPLIG